MPKPSDSRTVAVRVLSFLRRNRRDIGLYAATVLLSTAAGFVLLGFGGNFSQLPITYSADGITVSSSAKSLVDSGTYYTNPRLGAPGTAEFFDGPGADGAFVLELKMLALLTRDYVLTVNLFCLLSYPLIAMSALWTMRRLKLGRATSFVFSMLYALLPFHQSRIAAHTFLAAYFAVPLAIALLVELIRQARGNTGEQPAGTRRLLGLPLWCWLVAMLLGASGIYYAYFAIVLVGVFALLTAYSGRSLRVIVPFAGIGIAIILVVVAQMAPSFIYWSQAGPNNLGDARVPWESDLYGLRMTQLVFPMSGHRLPVFSHAKELYVQQLAQISDKNLGIAYDSSLGLVGAFGFFLLLLWVLGSPLRSPPDGHGGTPSILSIVGISAFLLGTVGGIGEIIAFVGFPQIRAYDRITVYIGFASLAAAAWFADWLIRRVRVLHTAGALSPSALGLILLGAILVLGMWDTTNPDLKPQSAATAIEYRSDDLFVKSIESVLPAGGAVLQLPYIEFPESAPINKMGGYDHIRLYLHSESLKWSAGAYKGRPAAKWQAEVTALPVADMLARAREAGFSGLVVDRFGYADAGKGMEASMSAAVSRGTGSVSPDGRYSFFDIR